MKTVNSSNENEIISIKEDIAKCESLTEEQVQEYFNTDDSKEEFMKLLQDELSFYEKELTEETETLNEVDCGFADMQDYINYKYY